MMMHTQGGGLSETPASGRLDPEALPLAVDVAQAQVDVGAHALQRLQAERAPQVLGVGPGGGQPKPEPGGQPWVTTGSPRSGGGTPLVSLHCDVPVHGAGLAAVAEVHEVAEGTSQAGVLGAGLGRAEVVLGHLVQEVMGDPTAPVRDPEGEMGETPQGRPQR